MERASQPSGPICSCWLSGRLYASRWRRAGSAGSSGDVHRAPWTRPMTDLSPPTGFVARPATRDDAPAVAALIAACQVAEGDEADMTVEELLTDWEGADLAEGTVV